MSNWPLNPLGLVETQGNSTGTSQGTSLSTTYTQLVAATTYDWQGFILTIQTPTSGTILITLGIGAGGSEQIIVDSLWLSNESSWPPYHSIYIPCKIPKGTRVAAKSNLSASICSIYGLSQGLIGINGACRLESANAFSVPNGGTNVDPGASSNTKGAWTQLVASTTFNWKGFLVALGTNQGTSLSSQWLVDIGFGGAGSECAVVQNLLQGGVSTKLAPVPYSTGPFPCNIPAGSRIAARAQCASSTATSRITGVAVYGIV